MDLFESTKMVFHRVENVDPENVYSIINHLLISDHNELQMIRLAFSPDPMLQDMINKVKLDIVSSPPVLQQPLVSNHPLSFTPPSCYSPQNSLLIPQMPLTWLDSGAFYPAPAMQPVMLDFIPPFRLFEMGLKPCSSFSQGFCKHGGSCGFLHILQLQNGDCMVLNPPSILSSGFLKQLEFEVVELLGSKPGIPVSVSSLPILYFDYFGKVLRIEKKLTFRVSQLLARISTYIRLTSRPHGRPSMLLVDDMDRFSGFGEAKGHELAVYLTFPTEGNFNEKDVHIYFKNFGPVQQVRIPGQVRRMFGFVTFVYPETVALVLSKRYPHYICGADVLVKPYQLRPGLVDRTTEEESSNEPAVDLPSSDGVVHGSSE